MMAGLLARASSPKRAFPGITQWLDCAGSSLTVAGAAAVLHRVPVSPVKGHHHELARMIRDDGMDVNRRSAVHVVVAMSGRIGAWKCAGLSQAGIFLLAAD